MCVKRVEFSSAGLLALEEDDECPAWRFGTKGWELAAIEPPLDPDPACASWEFEKSQGGWFMTRVLVDGAGAIYTVSGTGIEPGTRTTAHRVGGKSVPIGREVSALDPRGTFRTPDGMLWCFYFGALSLLQNGKWDSVGEVGDWPAGRLDPLPLNRTGPPWLFVNRKACSLWLLKYGSPRETPTLRLIEIAEAGRILAITSGISWTADTLLLSTDAGLRLYDPATKRLAKVDFPEPPPPVVALTRDGLGRLWLGGETGLWMLDANRKLLESFDQVPWLGRNAVYSLARDRQHVDGVIAALGRRGLVFIRADRRP
jgi:hypothetical protein